MPTTLEKVKAAMASHGATLTPGEELRAQEWCPHRSLDAIVWILRFSRFEEELESLLTNSAKANDGQLWSLARSLLTQTLDPVKALAQAEAQLTEIADKLASQKLVEIDRKRRNRKLSAPVAQPPGSKPKSG